MSAQIPNPKPNPAKNQKDQLDASKNLKERAQVNNPDTKAKKEASGVKKEFFSLPKKNRFLEFLELGFKNPFPGYLDVPSLGKLRAVSKHNRSLFSKHMWAFYLLDFVLNNKEEQMMAVLYHLLRNPEDCEAILLKKNGQEKYFGFKTKKPQVKTNWFGISPLQAAFLTGNTVLGCILLNFLPDNFLNRAKKQIEAVTSNPEVAKTIKDEASTLSLPMGKAAKEKASASIVADPKTAQDKGPTPPPVTAKNDDFLAYYRATIKANKDFYMAYDANEAEPNPQKKISLDKLKALWQARGRAQRLLPEHGLEVLLDLNRTSVWITGHYEPRREGDNSFIQGHINEHRNKWVNKVPKTLKVHMQYVSYHESWPLDLESIGREQSLALARQPRGGIVAIPMHDMQPGLATAARTEALGLENFCIVVRKDIQAIISILGNLEKEWQDFNKSQQAKALPGTSLPLANSKTEKEPGEKLSHEQEKNAKKEIPQEPLVFYRKYKFEPPLPEADPSLQDAVFLAVYKATTKKSSWWPF